MAVVPGRRHPKCIAASFSFGASVNGEFPSPRAPINFFAAGLTGSQLTASWIANADPNDSVTLTAGSYLTMTSAPDVIVQHGVSCQTTAASTPYTFPAAESAWALQYPILNPVSMTLTGVTDQVFPRNTPELDFALVRTYNSATASAYVNYAPAVP